MNFFDRIMHVWPFSIVETFYLKHKEMLLYLFFGGLTFLISVASFAAFNLSMKINELIANVLSWIIAVLFAFFTNRIWVFSSPTNTIAVFLKQMLYFFSGRVVTLILEEVILYIFITKFRFSSIFIKIIAQVAVIVANYVISKLFVFKEVDKK